MGLSEKEVIQSRKEHGTNEITKQKKNTFLHLLLESLGDPIIKILLIALGIKVVVLFRDFDWYETIGILIAIFLASFISSISEYGSEKAFSRLQEEQLKTKACVRRNGKIVEIPSSEIVVGDVVILSSGDKIPADGYLINGSLSVDESALNGETKEAKKVSKNGPVISDVNRVYRGSVVYNGEAEMLVRLVGDKTILGKISQELQEVVPESPLKIKLRGLAKTISRIGYVGAILASISYLFSSIVIENSFDIDLIRATISNFPVMFNHLLYALTLSVTIIVVAVPEGLPMMITLVLSSNMKKMLKDNVLVRKLVGIETAGSLNVLLTDKTGTLTKGNFVVTKITPIERKEEILSLAAIAEQNSNHPIAKSIMNAYHQDLENDYILTNIAGQGIMAKKGNQVIFCGNEKLMIEKDIDFTKEKALGTIIYVAKNDEFIGSILIEDEIKEETKDVISELNKMNCKTIMLTGDNDEIAQKVATEVGLTGYKASLLPQNKVEEVEELLNSKKDKEVLCFVGDGINDAPVLMRSDIGIAMGAVGSDAAIEASDIVLMKDDLRGISVAKMIAKKTMIIVFQNIIFSIIIKVLILVLSALGITNMWFAVFGDVGVSILAILNAMRVNTKYKLYKNIKVVNANT
jgi:heavy metal translocating P-type ATPase